MDADIGCFSATYTFAQKVSLGGLEVPDQTMAGRLTGDSGSGDRVGSFESRVIGVDPQLGYVFPIDDQYQAYLNLKGYATRG